MRDVGTFPLLTQQEETTWAKRYSEAKSQVQQLIASCPQLIFFKIAELLKGTGNVLLTNYIDLETEEDDSGEAPNSILRDLLQYLLSRSEEITRKFTSPAAADLQLDACMLAELADFPTPVKNIRFRRRFYNDCTDIVTERQWQIPGVNSEGNKRFSLELSRATRHCSEAMNVLVEGNLRLVISIARRYVCSLMPLSDLVQEGNLGLMRAVETFEYRLGHRFSTYASYWIRQAISHALNTYGRSIRMPVSILRQVALIRQAERNILSQTGNIPTVEELAHTVGLSVPRVRALQKMSLQPISLQALSPEKNDLNDFFSDEPQQDNAEVTGDTLRSSLFKALETLDPREREILICRFGLLNHPIETLEQLANRFAVTSERIRQLETNALRKLRRPEANRFLEDLRP